MTDKMNNAQNFDSLSNDEFVRTPFDLDAALKKSGDKRIYVLDTNVLLHDPTSIYRFEEHIVMIPLLALEEVDNKKSDHLIGFNAREVSQKLESLLEKSDYSENGIQIPNGKNGLLFFIAGLESSNFPKELSRDYVDNLFISQVMALHEKYPEVKIQIVTKDRNFRIKSVALGIDAEDYMHDKVSEKNLTDIFNPLGEIVLEENEVNDIFSPKEEGFYWIPYKRIYNLRYNQSAILTDSNGKDFGIGVRKNDMLKYFRYESIKVLDFGPKVLEDNKYNKNYDQASAIVQGLDDDVNIQVLIGRAGTGKTYLAMAIALEKVFKENKYHSIKMIKPVVSKSRLGEEVGFLPGSLKKKLVPHMRPFMEKLKMFISEDYLAKENGINKLMDEGVIEMMNM
ncbi:MAG: PhoH family protein, partial [Calditrichia bacterium]|nr:PhoH family protein [Calditrichia bacterium]